MIEDYVSPIDLELSRIANLKHIDWNGFSMCDQCGRRTIGIADVFKGRFTCFKCYMKKEAEILEKDPEWIRKEKVWKADLPENMSPIEIELQRIAIQAGNACGSSYQVCDKCGQKGRGFSNLMEGTFTCIKCHMKKEGERLDSDPEWIKKEKVWKMRKAISDRKLNMG